MIGPGNLTPTPLFWFMIKDRKGSGPQFRVSSEKWLFVRTASLFFLPRRDFLSRSHLWTFFLFSFAHFPVLTLLIGQGAAAECSYALASSPWSFNSFLSLGYQNPVSLRNGACTQDCQLNKKLYFFLVKVSLM